jgi:hypothetical protein
MKEEPFTSSSDKTNKISSNLVKILQWHEQVMNLLANYKVVQLDALE